MTHQIFRRLSAAELGRAVAMLRAADYAVDTDGMPDSPTVAELNWRLGVLNQRRRKTASEIISLALDDRWAA